MRNKIEKVIRPYYSISLVFFVFRDSSLKRRFFIQNNYGGCSNDAGWFLVIESNNCAWEQRTTRPYFVYSGKTGRDLQDSEYNRLP